jgi:hypothetical protein
MLGQVVATELSLDSFTTDAAVLQHCGQVTHRLRQDLLKLRETEQDYARIWADFAERMIFYVGPVVGRRLVLRLVHHRFRRPTHKIRKDHAETS